MTTMALCFTGGALIVAAIILLIGADIEFGIHMDFSAVRLKIIVRTPRGPRLIRVEYIIIWQDRTVYRNGKRLKPRKRKKLRHGRIGLNDALRAARRGIRIRELRAFGGCGIQENAYLSVLLTGILAAITETAASILEAESFCSMLYPAFDRDEFCLDMEGILRLYPAQIICAALNIPRKSRPNYPTEGHRA